MTFTAQLNIGRKRTCKVTHNGSVQAVTYRGKDIRHIIPKAELEALNRESKRLYENQRI